LQYSLTGYKLDSPISQYFDERIHLLDTVFEFNGKKFIHSTDFEESIRLDKSVDLTFHSQADHVKELKKIKGMSCLQG